MRIGALFGKATDGTFVLIDGPETPMQDLKAKFKKLAGLDELTVENKKIDQIVLFNSSGSNRKAKIKPPYVPEKEKPEGFAANLKELAEALKMTDKELKDKRDAHAETFPAKEADGYNVDAVWAWLATLENG